MDEQTLRKILQEELKVALDEKLKDYPTKEELKVALDEKLKDYPTKEDLKLELDDVVAQIVSSTDSAKAEKSEFEVLDKRIKKLEDDFYHN